MAHDGGFHQPCGSPNAALFGCSCIYLNPCVLEWVETEFSLNSTPTHSYTHGLRWIYGYPNKAVKNAISQGFSLLY